MTDEARFLKRKFDSLNLGQMGQNPAWNQVFCYFLKFGSLFFLEIAYNDSLQQCITSRRIRVDTIKIFGDQILAKGTKIGLETSFFCHFLKFCSLVFFEIAYNDTLQQCITSVRGKTQESFFWGPNLGQNGPKSGPKLDFFTIFSSLVH